MDRYEMLIHDIQVDYQIPPFYTYKALENHVKEGEAVLKSWVPNFNYEKDIVGQALLKEYVFYCYNKKKNEFQDDNIADITSWQMSQFGDKEDEEN